VPYQRFRRVEWIGTPLCKARMKIATKLKFRGYVAVSAERRTGPGMRRSSNSAFRRCVDRRPPDRSTEESAPPIGEAKPSEWECEDAERRHRKERRPAMRSIQFAGQEG